MKLSLPIKLVALVALIEGAIAPLFKPVAATTFDEFAVDQSYFIAVAVPYNYRRFRLAIIEQIPGQQPCWQESGSNPTTVDLLLLNFDHTHSCRKAVDTNGYSLRINGQDDKVTYTLNLIANGGELQLVADHQDPREADLVVGTSNGIQEAPMKINLDPNWQFTKRLYQGKAIQHIYVSNTSNPQYIDNIATLPTTNDPAQANYSTNNPSQPTQSNPPSQSVPTTQPIPAQPPEQVAQTDVEIVQGLVSSILNPLTQAVYQTYGSLFAPSPSTLGINQYQAGSSCQSKPGIAIWSDAATNQKADPTQQESQITADGILQLNNGMQIDIKPTLSSNNINPDSFLAGKNSVELDFDGDGQPEKLQIVEPPQPCNQ
ncbi:MAG: DUF3747 domain-containing protein [Pleurocapsa sp.]